MVASTPKTVKVRELPGEQPGGLKASSHAALASSHAALASSHAAFLDQTEPARDHAVVLRPVDPRVLMADGLILADRREHLVRELGPVVRSEAIGGVTDFGQEIRRCRGHVDRALAPEDVEPSHARRVIVEQGQVQSPPKQKRYSWGRQG